ncbi:translation initiation factor IF-2-like [Bubalus kerabau]|uniref:translation initiation factor IF-2-like n=1 Tax=Bubalus carabanensis TaxID=3119969 RepID=UPI000DBC4BF2|nr:uncharacterized protein LOC112584004 [Bubalus bubalis]XP_055435563.1 translation initiation factor IF-2-like [Bubalus carabanensis]
MSADLLCALQDPEAALGPQSWWHPACFRKRGLGKLQGWKEAQGRPPPAFPPRRPASGLERAPLGRGHEPLLGRLLRGNNAAPPGVTQRWAGHRTPERGQRRERAAARARGALAGGHGRGAVRGREAARPGGAGGRGAGPGPPLAGTEGAGPGGDEGARGGEPVCASRRRPALRESPSRQTRGRRSGGAPPPGLQNVKRGGRRRRDGPARRPRRPPAAAPLPGPCPPSPRRPRWPRSRRAPAPPPRLARTRLRPAEGSRPGRGQSRARDRPAGLALGF